MDFVKGMMSRYTTKQYDGTKSISESDIEQLKQVLQLSASSINSQPWHFTFVKDAATKEKLADASFFNKEKVLDSSHVVVFNVIDTVDNFESHLRKNLSAGAVAYFENVIKKLPEAQITAWLANQVYLSLGFFLSACASMGIDSTPMEGIDRKGYDQVLNQDGFKSLFAVAIGYRNTEDANQPSITPKTRLAQEAIITEV